VDAKICESSWINILNCHNAGRSGDPLALVVQPILITIIPIAQIAQSISFITVDYLF
jgi:hypothetical protein